jgi:hypothetical protein
MKAIYTLALPAPQITATSWAAGNPRPSAIPERIYLVKENLIERQFAGWSQYKLHAILRLPVSVVLDIHDSLRAIRSEDRSGEAQGLSGKPYSQSIRAENTKRGKAA